MMQDPDTTIDVRDFQDVPREEMRKRIKSVLAFVTGSLATALNEDEKRQLNALMREM